jgi:peroxiredoxin
MRKRVLILPISAAVIIAMCAYRISTSDPNAPKPIAPTANYRPAPEFELYDQHEPSETVRLEGYLGRHTIVIVFFDAKIGADRDPILARLRQDFDKIKSSGTKVFAISTALPQDNRKVIQQSGPFPFPLLSDPGRDVHNAWGVNADDPQHPVSAVFLIDRAGNVDWGKTTPRPIADPNQLLDRLTQP